MAPFPRQPKSIIKLSTPSHSPHSHHNSRHDQTSDSYQTASEFFPDWTEDDLLNTIAEANGDVEVAIVRITEGHATQFTSSSKPKKSKPAPSQQQQQPRNAQGTANTFAGPGRGGFAGARGGRGGFEGGRGGIRGGRGGRGVARGGLTPNPVVPRVAYANGDSNGATPASFVAPPAEATPAAPAPAEPAAPASAPAPVKAPVAPTWGPPKSAGAWSTLAAAKSAPKPTPSEFGAEASTAATTGWGEESTKAPSDGERPITPPAAEAEATTPTPAAPEAEVEAPAAVEPKAEEKAAPAAKSSKIPAGSIRSWAQIAR